MSITFFSSAEPELEAYGVELINWESRQLRRSITFPPLGFISDGPGFEYEFSPDLFLGRVGGGPLHVVWDTNLLIDCCQHGRALWQQELDPEPLGDYGDDLEALQLIMATWVIRDIRFHILPRRATYRHRLPVGRQSRKRATNDLRASPRTGRTAPLEAG